MEGAARRAQREHDEQLSQAWHVAAFGSAAYAGKLKPLKTYLRKPVRAKAQTPSDMLEVFREFQSRGANMRITRTN